MIKMKNLVDQNAWFWDDRKFLSRSFIIKVEYFRLEKPKSFICYFQEHYQQFLDGDENIAHISKEDDPQGEEKDFFSLF